MPRWRITVDWSDEVEAEDEGTALIQADFNFNFMNEATVEEVEEESVDELDYP